jgi:hypothetical protein
VESAAPKQGILRKKRNYLYSFGEDIDTGKSTIDRQLIQNFIHLKNQIIDFSVLLVEFVTGR